MAKLSINLLPPEFEADKKQKKRFSKTLKLSIVFLAIVIGIATVVLGLRLSQNLVLSNINKDLEKSKATLNSPEYNQKEGVALILKNRLDSIGTLLGQDTYSSYAYNLISGLTPDGVTITSMTIDNKGVVKLTAETSSIASLDGFFNQILDPTKNQKKITGINIDGLSQNKISTYRIDLSILLAGAVVKK